MDKDNMILQLENENAELKQKIVDLEERLKKYTAPSRSKTYFE
jgi:BMFP domain-containing protein YqiC